MTWGFSEISLSHLTTPEFNQPPNLTKPLAHPCAGGFAFVSLQVWIGPPQNGMTLTLRNCAGNTDTGGKRCKATCARATAHKKTPAQGRR